MERHTLIVGPRASGKTTALDRIVEQFESQGHDIVRVPTAATPGLIRSLTAPVSPNRRTLVVIDDVRANPARDRVMKTRDGGYEVESGAEVVDAVRYLCKNAEPGVYVVATAETWPVGNMTVIGATR